MIRDVLMHVKGMVSRALDILSHRKNGGTIFAFFLILFLGLTAYSNSFGVPFQFDDHSSIVDNPVIRHLDNFTSSLEGYHYNPRRVVGYATFALNYHFGGLNTVGYHAVNLAIHIINGFLVYFLIILTFETPYFSDQLSAISYQQDARRAGKPASLQAFKRGMTEVGKLRYDSRFLMALFAALLFVAHPLQTESVTYIVQRFASLATMFYLLSIVMYVKGRLASRQAGKLASFLFSLLCAVLAMGTKEIAYTLPVMILIFEFLFFTPVTGKRLLFLVASAAIIGLAILALANSGIFPGGLLSRLEAITMVQSYGSRWVYLMTELRVIISYLRLLIFPMNQSIDYDYPMYHSLSQPPVAFSALFLLSIIGMAGYLLWKSRQAGKPASLQADESVTDSGRSSYSFPPHRGGRAPSPASPPVKGGAISGCPTSNLQPPTCRYYRLIAFGILWFFVALSIESTVIPIADVIFEHRMYLPSVGAMIAVAAAAVAISVRLAKKGRTVAVIALTVIVTLFAAATYARNDVWASPIALWQDAIRKGPHHSRPYFVLGAEYARHGAYEKAIAMYRKALAMPPGEYLALRADEYPKMYNALGLLYARLGRYGEAIAVFQRLLGRYPGFAAAYNNLGAAYVNSGRYREAIGPLLEAVHRRQDNVDARYNLALAYYGSGDRNAAMREALVLKRFSPEAASELITQLK